MLRLILAIWSWLVSTYETIGNFLVDLLCLVLGVDRPGHPPREDTAEPAPRWLVNFNWFLLGFILGLFAQTVIAQLSIWGSR